MKTLACLALAVLSASSFSQTLSLDKTPAALPVFALQQRSISYEKNSDGTFGATVLLDGHKGFAGITISPTKTQGKFSLNGLIVTDTSGTQLYAGALGLAQVYQKNGWTVNVGLGLKGFDLSSGFNFDKKYPAVLGFTLKGKV